MTDRSSDPASIERELDETRARLGYHLDELTRRLSPGQLVDEALAYVRDGQGADFVRNLGAGVRDNPFPVALAGFGLAWLVVASSMQERPHTEARPLVPSTGDGQLQDLQDDTAERARQAGEALSRAADETEEAFRFRAVEARGRILGLQRQAEETAAEFSNRVQQALEAAQLRAQRGWQNMRDAGRHGGAALAAAVDRGRDAAGRAGSGIASAINDNPVLLAAFGMSAGALLGALIPRSSREDAYLGDPGRRMVDTARAAGEDLWARGAHAAEAAARAGAEAARASFSGGTKDRVDQG